MARERISEAIRDFRDVYPDTYLSMDMVGYPGLITSYLTEDGEAFKAQQVATFIVLAVNELMHSTYLTLKTKKPIDDMAALFPEYVSHKLFAGTDFVEVAGIGPPPGNANVPEGNWSAVAVPDDYGWILSARWAKDSSSKPTIMGIDDPFRTVDHRIIGSNDQMTHQASLYQAGSQFVCAGVPFDPNQSAPDSIIVTYIAKQAKIDLSSGTNDLLLGNRWDKQLLGMAVNIANFFKRNG